MTDTRRAEFVNVYVSCVCHRCIADHGLKDASGFPYSASRMILCTTCGNKRCPRASDHRLACTNSNEPGQADSVYGDAATAVQGGEPVIVGGIRYFDRDEGDYGVMSFFTEKGDRVHVAIDKKTISWMVIANDKAGTLLSASAEHPLYTAPPAARQDAWQPIETAPKDEYVLVSCGPGGMIEACRPAEFFGKKYEWFDSYNNVVVGPTHWMPLPSPPSDAAMSGEAK